MELMVGPNWMRTLRGHFLLLFLRPISMLVAIFFLPVKGRLVGRKKIGREDWDIEVGRLESCFGGDLA